MYGTVWDGREAGLVLYTLVNYYRAVQYEVEECGCTVTVTIAACAVPSEEGRVGWWRRLRGNASCLGKCLHEPFV